MSTLYYLCGRSARDYVTAHLAGKAVVGQYFIETIVSCFRHAFSISEIAAELYPEDKFIISIRPENILDAKIRRGFTGAWIPSYTIEEVIPLNAASFRELAARGADIDYVLGWACLNQDLETARLVIENDHECAWKECAGILLAQAARRGDIDFIEFIRDSLGHEIAKYYSTMLYQASFKPRHNAAVIKYLLEHGAKVTKPILANIVSRGDLTIPSLIYNASKKDCEAAARAAGRRGRTATLRKLGELRPELNFAAAAHLAKVTSGIELAGVAPVALKNISWEE